jgi:acylaminoacyl-peptidase
VYSFGPRLLLREENLARVRGGLTPVIDEFVPAHAIAAPEAMTALAGVSAAYFLNLSASPDCPAALIDAQPAKDLASQERVSDPHISPDGRFVAYNVRSTDWEANRGVNSLWILDRRAPNGVPRLIRDQEKGATQPRWSSDGQWLYFLSARAGAKQVWRTSPKSPQSHQVTSVPLDASFYRVSPDGHHLVVAASAYPECMTRRHGIGGLIAAAPGARL